MRRLGIRLARVAGLLGLAACAGGGSGTAAHAPAVDPLARLDPIVRGWIDSPPEGCAVGSSGPTLDPGDAIRGARLAAIEALAAESLSIDVRTVTGEGPDGSFEISAQALSGTLADARIVAVWAATDPHAAPRHRLRQVYALACWPDAVPRKQPDLGYPRWLIDPPSQPDRVCAVGLAGPTWRSEDQPASALRDARRALATALESRVEKRILDDGRGVARIARRVDPSPAALARAADAELLERQWLDERGRGPIGLPGVLYGMICIDD